MHMEHTLRRVVTGHDSDGKSIIVLDDKPAVALIGGTEDRRVLIKVWATILKPTPGGLGVEPQEISQSTAFEPRASEFRVVDMPAGSRREMHRTDTVDYGIVLAGEVHLVLEQEETLLHTGDVVVQRGTFHAWHNRSDRVARMAFINLSGQVTDERRCPEV